MHSLRIGGSTALYNQGIPLEEVMKEGRWKSTAVWMYLWQAEDGVNAVSNAITKSSGAILRSNRN